MREIYKQAIYLIFLFICSTNIVISSKPVRDLEKEGQLLRHSNDAVVPHALRQGSSQSEEDELMMPVPLGHHDSGWQFIREVFWVCIEEVFKCKRKNDT